MSPFAVIAASLLICTVAVYGASVEGEAHTSHIEEVADKVREYLSQAKTQEQRECLVKEALVPAVAAGKLLKAGLKEGVKSALQSDAEGHISREDIKASLKAQLLQKLDEAGIDRAALKEKAKQWAHQKKEDLKKCIQE